MNETKKLHDIYCDNPCMETVLKLCTILNKPKKSIISKLSKDGLYLTRGYVTKLGETPVTKLQIVRSVEDALDIKLPGLDKAPKATLKVLSNTVVDMAYTLEDTLGQITTLAEVDSIRQEMQKQTDNYDPITILHKGK